MLPRLRRDRAIESNVVDTLELLRDLSLEQLAGTLSRALNRISRALVHRLLDQDLLAGRYQLPHTFA